MIPASSLPWISAAEIPDIRTQTTYSHTLPASNVNKMQLLFSIVMCWSDLASWISNHDRHHLCYTKHWYGRASFIHILYWNLTFQANIQSSCIVNILLLLGFNVLSLGSTYFPVPLETHCKALSSPHPKIKSCRGSVLVQRYLPSHLQLSSHILSTLSHFIHGAIFNHIFVPESLPRSHIYLFPSGIYHIYLHALGILSTVSLKAGSPRLDSEQDCVMDTAVTWGPVRLETLRYFKTPEPGSRRTYTPLSKEEYNARSNQPRNWWSIL